MGRYHMIVTESQKYNSSYRIVMSWSYHMESQSHSNSMWQRSQLTTSMCQKAKLHARIKPTTLCSALDKENSIEFLLDLLYYIYNYYVAMLLCFLWSLCYSLTDFPVTYCDCDFIVMWLFCDCCHTFFCDFVTCHMISSHAPP